MGRTDGGKCLPPSSETTSTVHGQKRSRETATLPEDLTDEKADKIKKRKEQNCKSSQTYRDKQKKKLVLAKAADALQAANDELQEVNHSLMVENTALKEQTDILKEQADLLKQQSGDTDKKVRKELRRAKRTIKQLKKELKRETTELRNAVAAVEKKLNNKIVEQKPPNVAGLRIDDKSPLRCPVCQGGVELEFDASGLGSPFGLLQHASCMKTLNSGTSEILYADGFETERDGVCEGGFAV